VSGQVGERMPAQVTAAIACEERGFRFLGCQPLADGTVVAQASNPGGERLEAWGHDALDACWRLTRVARGKVV
jgi:hypothetical protein